MRRVLFLIFGVCIIVGCASRTKAPDPQDEQDNQEMLTPAEKRVVRGYYLPTTLPDVQLSAADWVVQSKMARPEASAESLSDLLNSQGDMLVKVDADRLVSLRTILSTTVPADVVRAYQEKYDRDARSQYSALVARPEATADQFYALARKWPYSSMVNDALTAGAARAVNLGDTSTAATLMQLASSRGVKLDEVKLFSLALCEAMDGRPGIAPPTSQSSEIVQKLGYRGPMPGPWAHFERLDHASLPRYRPMCVGGIVYYSTPTQAVAINSEPRTLWVGGAPLPDAPQQPSDIPLGQDYAPAVLCSDSGAAILVCRQNKPGTWDDSLRGIRASDGKMIWTTENMLAYEGITFVGTPTIAGRYLYAPAIEFGNDHAEMMVLAVDSRDGSLIWQASLGQLKGIGRIRGEDAMQWNGFGSQTEVAVVGSQIFITPNLGIAAALDRFSGKINWITNYQHGARTGEIPMRYGNTPAAGGVWGASPVLVIAPNDSASVIGLSLTDGSILWRTTTPGTLIGVFDQFAIIAGKKITALNLQTGQPAWQYTSESASGLASLFDGVVYIPTLSRLVTLDAKTGLATKPRFVPPNPQALTASSSVYKILGTAHIR